MTRNIITISDLDDCVLIYPYRKLNVYFKDSVIRTNVIKQEVFHWVD